MGDINQKIFLKRYVPKIAGPVLEIGSKDYGNTSMFRDFYKNSEYVGIDMEDGKNVDEVIDLTKGIGNLTEDYFELIICCSVLEHVNQPWVMAENITKLMGDGGKLYMSVPWVWRYHAYPDDYFRFSWRGIESLFPKLKWDQAYHSTNVENDIFPIITKSDSNRARIIEKCKYLPYLMVNMVGHK